MSSPTRTVAPLRIVSAWIVVAIPLGWGVYQSVTKSLPLFQATAGRPATSAPEAKPAPAERAGPSQSPREAQ